MNNLLGMQKKDTAQFNLRPPRRVISRLTELSQKFKRDATQVAVEVLEEYTELWAEAEQAKRDTISQQIKNAAGGTAAKSQAPGRKDNR
jgi:histone H3/H4